MNRYFKDYAEYLAGIFPGIKVQKISLNAGFSCPNRDGTIGRGGCIYCNNASFTPGYCMQPGCDVTSQLEKGRAFFRRKYPEMKYLAYFQSFTNTHGATPEALLSLYEEALAPDDVVGLIIGTRPDTFNEEVASLLGGLNRRKPVFVEFGAETSSDRTLSAINRGHTWQDTVRAVRLSSAHGLHTGLHLIAGLPGEDESQVLETVRACCRLPIESLKLHQLQVIEGTPLAAMYRRGEVSLTITDIEQYMALCCKIIETVPRHIAIERFLASAPPDMVIAPRWGVKNYEFTHRLLQACQARQDAGITEDGCCLIE